MEEVVDLKGPAVKGFGVGGRYIAHPYYSRKLGELLGCKPYPGTLNFQAIDWRELAAQCPPIVVRETVWEGKRLGAVYTWQAEIETVEGWQPCLVIRPLLSRHPPTVLEIVACQKLKEILPDNTVHTRIKCTKNSSTTQASTNTKP